MKVRHATSLVPIKFDSFQSRYSLWSMIQLMCLMYMFLMYMFLMYMFLMYMFLMYMFLMYMCLMYMFLMYMFLMYMCLMYMFLMYMFATLFYRSCRCVPVPTAGLLGGHNRVIHTQATASTHSTQAVHRYWTFSVSINTCCCVLLYVLMLRPLMA